MIFQNNGTLLKDPGKDQMADIGIWNIDEYTRPWGKMWRSNLYGGSNHMKTTVLMCIVFLGQKQQIRRKKIETLKPSYDWEIIIMTGRKVTLKLETSRVLRQWEEYNPSDVPETAYGCFHHHQHHMGSRAVFSNSETCATLYKVLAFANALVFLCLLFL